MPDGETEAIAAEAVLGPVAPAEIGGECLFVSGAAASPYQQRAAAALLLVSLVAFIAAAPFAQAQLPGLPVIVAIYEAVLITLNIVTMVLLYGQFLVVRSRALLVLTSAYLYSAVITFAHLLTFPGAFSPTGLLGAGLQSTAWLYWFWHWGFLVAVIGFALVDGPVRTRLAPAVCLAVLATVAAASALVLLATCGARYLPSIMLDWNSIAKPNLLRLTVAIALGLLAIALLWRERPRTLLVLSLMGVVWASMLDVTMAGFLIGARFQFGFYAGRVFGLLAAALLLIALLKDVNQSYRRAIASARAADLANQAKNRFLAVASHDLRQPLMSLSLFNGMLRRMATDERAIAAAAGQEQAIATMTDLLNSLLDISKLDSGRMGLRIADVSLDDMFDGLDVEFGGVAAAKGLRFDATRCGQTTRSDPVLLGQILRNLIGNAIRYTHNGSVRLGCEREGERLRIDVTDTGIGIGEDDMPHIFEEFYQAGVPPDATREGHGLGLAWVKRAARVLGCELRVWSQPGRGSVFSIVLPAAP